MAPHYLVLVEGNDDQHVVRNILRHHNISCEIAGRDRLGSDNMVVVKLKEGFENLRDTLDVELDEPDLERLAIIVDADTDLDSRWRSLRNRLIELGAQDMPDVPGSDGLVISVQRLTGLRTVGLWIMPDNTTSGILEHFIEFLVPAGDTLLPRARACVDHIPEHECLFREPQKAYIHTWLAWQAEPGRPLGLAIIFRFLDANAPHAERLVAWIRRVFAI